jgi:hypothetical protein
MWKKDKFKLIFICLGGIAVIYAIHHDISLGHPNEKLVPTLAATIATLLVAGTISFLPSIAKKFDSVFDWINKKLGLKVPSSPAK